MYRKITLLFLSFIVPVISFAQSFDLDYVPDLFKKAENVNFEVSSDGATYLMGNFTEVNTKAAFNLVKLNSDGSTDETFDIGTGFDGRVFRVRVLTTGKVLVMGFFHHYQGKPVHSLVRLNQDGSLDESFDMGTGPGPGSSNDLVGNAYETADGKLLVVGNFRSIDGILSPGVARLNANGSVDPSFTTASISGLVFASFSVMQPNDQILVQVFRTNLRQSHIIRLNNDGTLDETFTPFLVTTSNNSFGIQSDGKVVVSASGNINGNSVNGMYRLNADGTLDENFDVGSGTAFSIMNIAINSQDQILISGISSFDGQSVGVAAILEPNGSFLRSIATSDSRGDNITIQPDGKILVFGFFDRVADFETRSLVRFNTDETIDRDFITDIQLRSGARGLALGSEGEAWVGGTFEIESGDEIILSKVTPEGTLEFNAVNSSFANVRTVKRLLDGNIAVGGSFSSFGTSSAARFAIINPDGTNDETFNGGTGFDEFNVWDFDELSDGKLLLGGPFKNYNNESAVSLIKLNRDGTRDVTFDNPLAESLRNVLVIEALADGKAMISAIGDFGSGVTNQIFRLNADGSLDDTFLQGQGPDANSVDVIKELPDGRYLLGGDFFDFGPNEKKSLILMNNDGTIDPGFEVDLFINGGASVRDIAIVGEDIYLVGRFNSFDDIRVNGFIRIDITGELDEEFRISTSNETDIQEIEVTEEGELFVSGTIRDQTNGFSSVVAKVIFPPKGMATNLEASQVTGQSVSLSWVDDATDKEGFAVERSEDDGNTFIELDRIEGSATAYIDENVQQLSTYIYRVTPYFKQLNGEVSNEVTVTVPLTPPSVPSSVEIVFFNINQLDLSWTDNADNEESIVLERSVNGDDFLVLTTLAADTESYQDVMVEPGNEYRYRLKAMNEAGSSEYTSISQFAIPLIPQAPGNLISEFTRLVETRLSWTDNADNADNEDNFIMERAVASGDFEIVATLDADVTSYIDTNVDLGQTYSYRIKAVNISGESDFSNVADIVVTSLESGVSSSDSNYVSYYDPLTSNLHFELLSSSGLISEARLLTTDGRLQKQEQHINAKFVNLDLSKAVSGVYLLQVATSEGNYIVKYLIGF